jgi:hypothetical protein
MAEKKRRPAGNRTARTVNATDAIVPPTVGASAEVLRHHAKRHERRCPSARANIGPCPCGPTHVIACDRCGAAVFVAVAPGTWCMHAEAVSPR